MPSHAETVETALAVVGFGSDLIGFIGDYTSWLGTFSLPGGIPGLYAAKYTVAAAAGQGMLAALVGMVAQAAANTLPIKFDVAAKWISGVAIVATKKREIESLVELIQEAKDLKIPLPGGREVSIKEVNTIIDEGIQTPNLNEVTFDGGLSTDLPDNWAAPGFGANPYKHLGNYRVVTHYDATGKKREVAVKFGVPGMVPTIDPRPEEDYPLLECSFPRTLVPDVIIPNIRVPEKSDWA